ncbi:carbohydrate esterase family 4 protein [Backusella circina FSU 941]|nr:carbohydrate esterase family 4 protein [Backusella circina FSU 941]
MQFKFIALFIAFTQTIAFVFADVSSYWESFTSLVDPKNISIPAITQTTSYDVTTECTYYTPDASLITINSAEWPLIWKTATTNGMNTSAEFTSLYNSIDWTKAPSIQVRTRDINGNLDLTGYDAVNDPDCWWSASVCTTPKISDVNPDIVRCPEPETWGLTYDDGPNCSHNAFYDYLLQNNLKASMFYIGSNVIDWPYGAMRGVVDGHHIASHTWSHTQMTTLTNEEVLAELYYTQKAIKLATGLTPRYWRPPYGDVDDRVRWIASQLGLTAIIWNLDTNDWSAGTTVPVSTVQQSYEDYITMGTNGTFASSGNIVLTHEITNETMSLALDYLPKITSAYKQVIDVATCYNISYPYFENVEWTNVLNGTSSSSGPSTSSGSSYVKPNLALAILLAAAVLLN